VLLALLFAVNFKALHGAFEFDSVPYYGVFSAKLFLITMCSYQTLTKGFIWVALAWLVKIHYAIPFISFKIISFNEARKESLWVVFETIILATYEAGK